MSRCVSIRRGPPARRDTTDAATRSIARARSWISCRLTKTGALGTSRRQRQHPVPAVQRLGRGLLLIDAEPEGVSRGIEAPVGRLINCATRSSSIVRGLPGRASSQSRAMRRATKRSRHLPTGALLNLSRSAPHRPWNGLHAQFRLQRAHHGVDFHAIAGGGELVEVGTAEGDRKALLTEPPGVGTVDVA